MSTMTEAPPRTCVAFRDWNGMPPVCGKPAVWRLTYGCVHEHLSGAWMCDACMARLRPDLDRAVCVPCEGGPEPHECHLLVDIKPANGAP